MTIYTDSATATLTLTSSGVDNGQYVDAATIHLPITVSGVDLYLVLIPNFFFAVSNTWSSDESNRWSETVSNKWAFSVRDN